MYVLIRVSNNAVLQKVRKYLGILDLWFKEFNEPEYRVDVTAEDRKQYLRVSGGRGDLNPSRAWETCASFVQIWEWDNLGRGPWAGGDRAAGECASPKNLNYISCPKWCAKYEPVSIDAAIFVAEKVAEEHERRAEMLRAQIVHLRQVDLQYREAIKTGGVFEYKNGKFVIVTPEA